MGSPIIADDFDLGPRNNTATPQAQKPVTSGPGSWGNPRVRKDGKPTRATTVHLALDVAQQLDEVRIRTHRRLSDLLDEAARQWLRTHR